MLVRGDEGDGCTEPTGFDGTEFVPGHIQREMQATVSWLQSLGFHTTDSGDGHSNAEGGMEDTIDFPHVVMVVAPGDLVLHASMLATALASCGLHVEPQGRGPVWISATYDPGDNSAVIMLAGVNDAALGGK